MDTAHHGLGELKYVCQERNTRLVQSSFAAAARLAATGRASGFRHPSCSGLQVRFHRQTFNQTAARISATSLSLAATGLIIPTIFHLSVDRQPGGWSPQAEQHVSPAIAAVALAVWIVAGIGGDGECNWLEGVQLVSVYLIITILCFFLPETGHPH